MSGNTEVLYNIKSENTFTLTAAKVLLGLKDTKQILRGAIRYASGPVETHGFWFGDNHTKDRFSRSWHIAITRDLSEAEKASIEFQFRKVCRREKWGRLDGPGRFFQWNVRLDNRYLENHWQQVPKIIIPRSRELK
jgi:hypothetical protein